MQLSWLPYVASDRSALEAIQAQLNGSVDKNLELPDLSGKSIRYALVARDHAGEILGCWYAEEVLELKFCSVQPAVTASARKECWETLCDLAKAEGLRYIHCPVPKGANERIHEALTEGLGMYQSDNDFFIKDLR